MKLKIFVHSFKIPTTGFADKEGAVHSQCVGEFAHAQNTAFQGLERHAGLFGDRCLPNEERDVLMRTEDFCKRHGLELDVVDVCGLGFYEKLQMWLKGMRTPAVCCEDRILKGDLSEDSLTHLLEAT